MVASKRRLESDESFGNWSRLSDSEVQGARVAGSSPASDTNLGEKWTLLR